jgi:hypothetical protein
MSNVFRLFQLRRWAIAVFFLFWATLSICETQARIVLCRDGDGNFDAEFRTGVKVHVGAARDGGLATRTCGAKLSWEKQELVVASGASQLDLDAFGVDLGDGVPVAAFQVKKPATECCMEYRIFSLEKPPRLLRTISGGDFFSAADMNLDGNVEIWTHDAVAVDGFENFALGELDSPPSVVFRFTQGRLLDVSAEFQSYFDHEIARIRTGILPQDLDDFKSSDGKLTTIPSISAGKLHRLRMVKIKALEIAWAYLYSGREPEALRSLAEMWPTSDIDRIRAALTSTRARGIHSQADGTPAGPSREKKKHAHIFDAARISGPGHKLEVTPPRAILLQRFPGSEIRKQGSPDSEQLWELVIDAAGKVRAAKPVEKSKESDPDLLNAALTWKFIPALKDGRPVACRMRLAVSLRR